jgi:ABC-2 type transport system permease protein
LLDSTSYIEYVTINPDTIKKNYSALGYDAYIVIPQIDWQKGANNLVLKTDKTYGVAPVMQVEGKLNTIWTKIKSEKLGIDESKRQILNQSKISIDAKNVNDEKSNAKIASGIGYACGFLIYFIMLIYGSQVMMGVMEEKTNRIAEVMVSSIRPFQLMLGKIIGIGLVALTQFALWIAFIFIIFNVTKASGGSGNNISGLVGSIQTVFTSINVPLIIFCFAFYLLGGFFFYSSLYAAIGSAVNEDMREAQSLAFPVTLLVIFSIILMTSAMADPTGPLAFWASIIPFSSPIVMMARIPFGVPGTVPWWQLGLSMALLVLGFIFTTWFAGKIYRTGILMYGKKPSWKEMIKWAFRKS